jgi:hypothetical protein
MQKQTELNLLLNLIYNSSYGLHGLLIYDSNYGLHGLIWVDLILFLKKLKWYYFIYIRLHVDMVILCKFSGWFF